MPVEKRIDPEDGEAYTWEELSAYYAGKYKKKALADYWEDLKVAKSKATSKSKSKAKAKPEPKPKAKPKAKVKAKAKAKASKPRVAGPFKVCVCGGAGGIGQPLCMLMATDPNVKELCVFDLSVAMVPPAGVAADLSHLEKPVKVNGYVMEVGAKAIDNLEDCLTGCDLVLIPAGMPRKPGMTRDDLFKVNADIAKGLVEACAKFCPNAMLALIVNPVNSIVPAMAELYKKKELDPNKIVGVTTLDCVRANKFVGEITGKNPKFINIPVIGGHAGVTIMPVFSQDKAASTIDAEKIPDLDKKVQDAGTEVVNAKGGKGSATLSMAYAGARLGSSILAGLAGRKRVECAYVKSDITDLPYFTQKVVFGPKGIEKLLPIGKLNEYEEKRLEEAKTQLKGEIETGMAYAEANSLA
jgi:malate dehydrogenase